VSRVLVIDDERDITRFIQRALENDGHEVATANSGIDGLRLATQDPSDLVILDLAMPGFDGQAVLAAVKTQKPDQRVMILSAVGDVETRVQCLEQGAVDFLAKPFALRELLARVRCRVQDPAGNSDTGSVLSYGIVSLDLRRREARVHDTVVPLSSREFLLLSHLIRHGDNVCSRQELLAEVWGYDFDPGTNVVDVYVRRLRLKMPVDMIRTVRNVGYQLQSA
jgi:DNA-binding response OmpR family regulator